MWFILSLASISSLKLHNKDFQFAWIQTPQYSNVWWNSILPNVIPSRKSLKVFQFMNLELGLGSKTKICLEFKIHRSLNHRIIHYLKVQLLNSIDLLLSLEFLVQKWSFTLTRETSRQPSQREAKPHFKLKKKVKTNILLTCKLNKNNLSIFFISSFQIPRRIWN